MNALAQQKSHQLLSYLRKRQDDMVHLLSELALVETPSHVPESQAGAQSMLRRALQDHGFRVRKIPGRRTGGQLLAIPKNRKSSQPIQLLMGHCDTVWPLGTLNEMPVHVHNGKLFGPGVYDMKAGLVQILFALQALRNLGETPSVLPVVLVNSDEEIGSPESKLHIRRLAKLADRVFVTEPSLGPSGKLKTTRKGVGRFSICVKGKASHAGLAPEEGASAILELSHVVQQLFALNNPEQGVTVNVGTIDGGLLPNVVAPESRAEVDVRVATQKDADCVESAIRKMKPVTPGTRLEISGGIGRPPLEKTPRNEQLWNLAVEAADELGIEISEGLAGGGSDGNWTSQHTATLDGLGAVGDGAHAITEFVYVDRLAERCALLARMLLYPGDPGAPLMIDKPMFSSLTRISDLDREPYEVRRLDKSLWATGDYVAGIVTTANSLRTQIELRDGRMSEPMMGDHIIGAFGVRAATLEAVGHWNAIDLDDHMQALTGACLFGKATSVSSFICTPINLSYCGHCMRGDRKVRMRDFVSPPARVGDYDRPTILLIGTSMSSGKTTTAKVIIRHLVRMGLRVAGSKLTGAGRLRDTLAMRDAGAESIVDFVDAGLPSTVCSAEEYEAALATMTATLTAAGPDVVVAEAGASPIEPYNGDTLMKAIQPHVRCTVLCASDPYAVIGVTQGFGFKPDLVAGLATSTTAGVEVIEELAGVKALNVLDPASLPALKRLVNEKLGLR